MVIVSFCNSNGQERIISRCKEEEALGKITAYCALCGYQIPYIRSWEDNGRTKYDVGSHTEFFYVEEEK